MEPDDLDLGLGEAKKNTTKKTKNGIFKQFKSKIILDPYDDDFDDDDFGLPPTHNKNPSKDQNLAN